VLAAAAKQQALQQLVVSHLARQVTAFILRAYVLRRRKRRVLPKKEGYRRVSQCQDAWSRKNQKRKCQDLAPRLVRQTWNDHTPELPNQEDRVGPQARSARGRSAPLNRVLGTGPLGSHVIGRSRGRLSISDRHPWWTRDIRSSHVHRSTAAVPTWRSPLCCATHYHFRKV